MTSTDDATGHLAAAVEQLLAESRLPVEQFAKKAGMSRKQLDRILSGETTRPQDHTLRKIARAGGRDSEALIAVRDEGAPLPPAGDEDDLRGRIDRLERTVDQMGELLDDLREHFMPPPGNGRGPTAR